MRNSKSHDRAGFEPLALELGAVAEGLDLHHKFEVRESDSFSIDPRTSEGLGRALSCFLRLRTGGSLTVANTSLWPHSFEMGKSSIRGATGQAKAP